MNFTREMLLEELAKCNYRNKYYKILKNTIYSLIIIIAISLIISSFIFPVLEISGNSMEPALTSGNLTVARKTKKLDYGDVLAFYYGNKILVKRVIALPGDWVNIDNFGNVYVNGNLLIEDYVTKKCDLTGDIEYPYQVPNEEYFVLSDNRNILNDSRVSEISSVAYENIIGKVFLKIYPIKSIKLLR